MTIPLVILGIYTRNTFLIAAEDDFEPQVILTITFSSISSISDTSCAMYTITGDNLKEEDESFSLSVTAINDVDIIDGDATIFITIEDDGDGMYMCGICYKKCDCIHMCMYNHKDENPWIVLYHFQ